MFLWYPKGVMQVRNTARSRACATEGWIPNPLLYLTASACCSRDTAEICDSPLLSRLEPNCVLKARFLAPPSPLWEWQWLSGVCLSIRTNARTVAACTLAECCRAPVLQVLLYWAVLVFLLHAQLRESTGAGLLAVPSGVCLFSRCGGGRWSFWKSFCLSN